MDCRGLSTVLPKLDEVVGTAESCACCVMYQPCTLSPLPPDVPHILDRVSSFPFFFRCDRSGTRRILLPKPRQREEAPSMVLMEAWKMTALIRYWRPASGAAAAATVSYYGRGEMLLSSIALSALFVGVLLVLLFLSTGDLIFFMYQVCIFGCRSSLIFFCCWIVRCSDC